MKEWQLTRKSYHEARVSKIKKCSLPTAKQGYVSSKTTKVMVTFKVDPLAFIFLHLIV